LIGLLCIAIAASDALPSIDNMRFLLLHFVTTWQQVRSMLAYLCFPCAVRVADPTGLYDEGTVTVQVTDVNEKPTIQAQELSIAEQYGQGTDIGTLQASDPDGDGLKFTWSYSGTMFLMSETGDVVLAQQPSGPGTHRVTVTVEDGGGLSSSAQVTIRITDTNFKPSCTPKEFTIPENSPKSTATSPSSGMVVTDRDVGDEHTWSLIGDDGVFQISSSSGKISLAKAVLDHETRGFYNLTVQVSQ